MAYYDAKGNLLSNADAAELQYAGHVVFDVNGNPVAFPVSTVPIDAAGDTTISVDDASA